MLLRPVFTSSANPSVLETSLVPVDASQSRNFISYRAERGWHGLWNISLCYYLDPSDCADRIARGQKLELFGDVVTLKHPRMGERTYQGVHVNRVVSNLPLSSALQRIKNEEQSFIRTGADSVAFRHEDMQETHFGLALPHITPTILETTRVIADESSEDFVSYRAIRQWNKKWGLYFCDYLPANSFGARMAQEEKHRARGRISHIWEGIVRIADEQGKNNTYQLVTTKCRGADMTLNEVLRRLEAQEKSFEREWTRRYLERSHVQPHPDHYLRFLMK